MVFTAISMHPQQSEEGPPDLGAKLPSVLSLALHVLIALKIKVIMNKKNKISWVLRFGGGIIKPLGKVVNYFTCLREILNQESI